MVADGPHDGGTASENDIESTADPPITVAIDAPLSSNNNKHLSAEPPRWRFVADAKRTSGYSTLAAGHYIAGKSSEELAAKYVAPDVSLYKAKGEKPDVGKLQHQPHAKNNYSTEGLKVGKLKLNSNDNDASSDLNTEVAKLETKPKEEDDLSQLQTDDVPTNEFEEGGDDENKLEAESATCIKSNREMPSGTDSTPDQNGGGQLCDHLDEEDRKEDINLNSPEVSCEEDIDYSAKESNPRRGHRFLYPVVLLLLALVIVLGVLLGKKNNPNKSFATTSNNAATSPYVSNPIIIVNNASWPSSYPSVVTTILSNGPSTMPSPAPSAECISETKAFSIEHPKEGKIIESTLFGSSSHATWILKNACSGEVISQCHPCSLGSLSLTSSKPNMSMKRGADKNAFTRRTEQQLLQNITECLPINNEYVFEVQSSRESESCCGFDPGSFILLFDNVALTHDVLDGSDAYDNDWPSTYFFGESETACNKAEVKTSSSPTKSASPKPSLVPSASRVRSTAPSASPFTNPPTLVPTTRPVTFSPSEAPTSVSPTKAPASQPTTIPSLEPIAASPTTIPLASLGACPETYGHFSSYTIGARVESNGFVYQCITVSCRSYGLEPGRRWKIVGSCSNRTLSPTVSPSISLPRIYTTSPSKAPSDPPSASPSERPSNSPIKQPSASPFASPTKALPTISPSKGPSWLPTKNPSKAPTQRPSTSLSRRPSTSPNKHPSISPTTSPTISPTGSPSKVPSQLPTGSPSNGPTYNPTTSPIDKPTISPSKHPSAVPSKHPSISPSKKPSANPSTVPTSKVRASAHLPFLSSTSHVMRNQETVLMSFLYPTNVPSGKPSPKPTLPPTNIPILKPMCSADQEPFSLCLAINMSGSICNGYTGALCVGCPQIIASSDIQESFCRDVGVSWRSCCSNFAYVKELATLIVNLLGDLPVDKSFSVVQFASDARVVSGLSSTAQTLSTIGQLTYSGGLDNHADAIQKCEQSLSSSFNEKKMIMLITDGETGVPAYVPEGATESAATSAKNKGTFIFPVLVSPDAPDTNEGAIPLLSRISSSGKVFDFTDNNVSSDLQAHEDLLNHVLCSWNGCHAYEGGGCKEYPWMF